MRHLPLAALALLAGCSAAAQEEARCLPRELYLSRLHERAGEDLVMVLVQDATAWFVTINPRNESWSIGTQTAQSKIVCLFQSGVGVFPPQGQKA